MGTIRGVLPAGALFCFAFLSFFAYFRIPMPPTHVGEAEAAILLNSGLGAVIGGSYAILRQLASPAHQRNRPAQWVRRGARTLCLLLAPGFILAYLGTREADLLVPLPGLLTLMVISLKEEHLHPRAMKEFLALRMPEDRAVAFVTKHRRLRQLAQRRSRRIATLYARAGEVGNPYAVSARSLMWLLTTALSLGVVAFLASIWESPLFGLVGLLPVALYFSVEIRLHDKISQRREGVEKELPFFSILVNVLGSAGVPLYTVLEGIVDSEIFTRIRAEARLVKRDVGIFGADPNESLERLASNHPSKKFSSFLDGYSSKVRSGGDMPAYLAGESGFLLRELEEEWARYAGRAGMIGSMMITVFGVIPLLLMVVGMFSPGVSIFGLALFTGLGVPLFTILLVYLAGRMQPVGERVPKGAARRSLLLSIPGLGFAALANQVWLAAASGLFLFLVVYGFSVKDQIRQMKEVDEALPGFLKDLLEFKRQEYDLARAVVKIAERSRYSPTFDRLLSQVAVQIKAGVPVDELAIDAKTRLARMVFFVLGKMSLSGGGTVETVYQLSAYTSKVVEMKHNAQAEMRPYLLLSYLSPVLLAFGVAFVGGILRSFSGTVSAGLSTLHQSGYQVGGASAAMSEISSLLVVVSAAALGIIGAKMVDFTIRNTLRASINVVVAVSATFALTFVSFPGIIHLAV